jgi:hypothetical protein
MSTPDHSGSPPDDAVQAGSDSAEEPAPHGTTTAPALTPEPDPAGLRPEGYEPL